MTLRNWLLIFHIVFAALLLGPAVMGGLYVGPLIRAGREKLEVLKFVEKVEQGTGRAAGIIFLLGIALVLRSHKAYKFSQTWVWLAMILFIAAAVNGAVFLGGTVKRAISKIENGESATAEAARASLLGILEFVIFFTIVYLMVKKPGL